MRHPWLNRIILPVAILVVNLLVPIDEEDAPEGAATGVAASVIGLQRRSPTPAETGLTLDVQ